MLHAYVQRYDMMGNLEKFSTFHPQLNKALDPLAENKFVYWINDNCVSDDSCLYIL
jgi:hypothetical protein